MNLRFLLLAGVCAIGAPIFAQTTVNDHAAVQVTPGQASYTNKMRVAGTVTSIDYATRAIALHLEDGRDVSMVAGPKIERFTMIKAGDKVIANYEESLLARVISKGSQPVGWRTTDSEHRDTGTVSGSMTTTGVLVANITKVDKKTSTVTFQGANESRDVVVSDPKQLALMKVGGQLEVTITGTLALSVEPIATN